MGDWVTVTGVRPYDGRYEIDILEQPLTTREWGWIKKHAGYLPATLGEDWLGDPEFIAVLAVIALRRNDRIENREVPAVLEKFQDAPFGTAITIEVGERDEVYEGDAGPPPSRTSSNGSSTGHGSTTITETSESPPAPTGPLPLGISESDPAMSVS
jgi:hypothetical protein